MPGPGSPGEAARRAWLGNWSGTCETVGSPVSRAGVATPALAASLPKRAALDPPALERCGGRGRRGGAGTAGRGRGGGSSRRPSRGSEAGGFPGEEARGRLASVSTRLDHVGSAPPGPAPAPASSPADAGARRWRGGEGGTCTSAFKRRGYVLRPPPAPRAPVGGGVREEVPGREGEGGVRWCAGAVAGRQTVCFQNGGSDGCGYPERHQQRRGQEAL